MGELEGDGEPGMGISFSRGDAPGDLFENQKIKIGIGDRG
jgi:hypothetical protein